MKRISAFAFLTLPLTFLLSGFQPVYAPAGELIHLAKLPDAINESSGLELADTPNTYWTHNDAGNAPVLYQINEKGKLLKQVTISGATNTDWEDLAKDNAGNLYIGDTGNNSNKRKDLKIYKVALNKGLKAQEIKFTYEDLPAGKIAKEGRNFDCEAFFWHSGKLYLISKDRGASRTAKLYSLPDDAGTHTARLVSKKELPGMVTSADLSPDGRHMAVLTYGKVHLYPVAKGSTQFFAQKPRILDLPRSGQAEAVLFKDNRTLILSNEEGNLFKYTL
ncbi:hypothetical protein [Sabulibacter ruber]|uniref:hypothetical protein n=1 Tax=Sabulibacter ruber TaxID=2811901 RepID=UPI001A96A81E|nr:hypothetical protein [Sabulibacter ruber]